MFVHSLLSETFLSKSGSKVITSKRRKILKELRPTYKERGGLIRFNVSPVLQLCLGRNKGNAEASAKKGVLWRNI
jgi:hypothetical protein